MELLADKSASSQLGCAWPSMLRRSVAQAPPWNARVALQADTYGFLPSRTEDQCAKTELRDPLVCRKFVCIENYEFRGPKPKLGNCKDWG